jgi:hypothetical protein
MSFTSPALNLEWIGALCTRLRVGASERVAVEALGVSWDDYQDWFKRAAGPAPTTMQKVLADQVRQALAEARLAAEISVKNTNPKAWLLYGPGRKTETADGWGPAARPTPAPVTDDTKELVLEMCEMNLDTLNPFPEARVAFAKGIDRFRSIHEQKATDGLE